MHKITLSAFGRVHLIYVITQPYSDGQLAVNVNRGQLDARVLAIERHTWPTEKLARRAIYNVAANYTLSAKKFVR